MTEPAFLFSPQGRNLAYHHHAGSAPGVMFLGGFKSDMTGSKAIALEAFCTQEGISFTRFDYSGHGQSSGEFKDGDIGDWLNDAADILDAITTGSQILVGSSMGGWIMLLLALARPERVKGLVGIAAAPDFTTKLMWPRMTSDQQQALMTQGFLATPSEYSSEPYIITRHLIEESKNYLVMDGPIDISCPVRLLHGMDDADVPWQHSVDLAEKLVSADVRVSLVKRAGHRFSEPEQLKMMEEAVISLLSC